MSAINIYFILNVASPHEELGTVRIREEDIEELLEEIRGRDQFDEEFDIDNDEKITDTKEVDEIDWI